MKHLEFLGKLSLNGDFSVIWVHIFNSKLTKSLQKFNTWFSLPFLVQHHLETYVKMDHWNLVQTSIGMYWLCSMSVLTKMSNLISVLFLILLVQEKVPLDYLFATLPENCLEFPLLLQRIWSLFSSTNLILMFLNSFCSLLLSDLLLVAPSNNLQQEPIHQWLFQQQFDFQVKDGSRNLDDRSPLSRSHNLLFWKMIDQWFWT